MPETFIFDRLEEKGRLQYFFHSPSSELPVRDVSNEQGRGHKTEPHIEIGAENYIYCCYQPNNIVPFLKKKEKYLFLFTTCRDKKHKYYREKCIMGYIIKKEVVAVPGDAIERDHLAVRGKVAIYSFDDSLRIKELGYSENTRMHLVDPDDTKKILDHFKGRKDILNECVRKIKELDKDNINKNKPPTCRVLRHRNCRFKDKGCLRWSLP